MGVRISQLFLLFAHKQTNSYAIDCPTQSIKLSKSQTVSLLIPILFLPREVTRGETHFLTLNFIKENFLGKNVCLHVINCKR